MSSQEKSQCSHLIILIESNMISNLFNFQEKEILWIPVLTFENTENKPFTLADEKTSITVKKQGEFSISKVSSFDLLFIHSHWPVKNTNFDVLKVEDVENQQFFEGEENSMTMSRFIFIEFYFADNIFVHSQWFVYHGYFSHFYWRRCTLVLIQA